MDPDASLAEQRRLIARVQRARDTGTDPAQADLVRIAELAEAIDTWILHGGYLPQTWDRRRTVDREEHA